MSSLYWTYILLVFSLELIFVTQAQRSYYSIFNFKIQTVKFNDSFVSFCPPELTDICVKSLDIKFGTRSISITDQTVQDAFTIDTDGPLKVQSILSYNIKANNSVIFNTKNQLLNTDLTNITLEFLPDPSVVSIFLKMQCQAGYIGATCNELNLCETVPPNLCKNNGLCYQQNGKIRCNCTVGFSGDYCLESTSPCQDNQCSPYSTCRPDNTAPTQYRCECQPGYAGATCYKQLDSCAGNACSNNSSCKYDEKEKLGYRCLCTVGYSGKFCNIPDDNCAKNRSICSHYQNATCLSTKNGHVCYCEGGCTIQGQKSLPFKWPFSELISFLFVVLEGVVIVMLIVLIIILQSRRCHRKPNRDQAYLDDNLLSVSNTKSSKDRLEFGTHYARQPIILEDLDHGNSLNPIYDINDLQSFGNNHLNLDNSGMSTFGRR